MDKINKVVRVFENLSIRARFGFSLKSFGELLKTRTSQSVYAGWQITLSNFSSYTSEEFLDRWQEYAVVFLPVSILEDGYDPVECFCITHEEYLNIKTAYLNSPSEFMTLLDAIYEIGTCELYRAVAQPARDSLDLFQCFLREYQANGGEILPFDEYLDKKPEPTWHGKPFNLEIT